MKESFIELREGGATPSEIASKFGVSKKTMYNHLEEIANEAGVSRESLLEMPWLSKKRDSFEREYIELAKINTAKDMAHFETVLAELGNVRQAITDYLTAQEAINLNLEGGMSNES